MKIAIVDGYSTGAALADRLHSLGHECVHIQSRPEVNPYLARAFRAEHYAHDLGFAPDTTRLTTWLRRNGVARVVAGSESGVTLAESVSLALDLPTNSAARLRARRDKALMASAVRIAGLATPHGTVARSAAEAADWFMASKLAEAVVKPLASAGTDNVTFCQTPQEVAEASQKILASRTAFGEPNSAVLVQEVVHGTEFYINSVSAGGVHRVAEIWRYTKRRGLTSSTPIYDFEEPVPASGREGRLLRAFVFSVLEALGITETPAHTEVMLTSDGPVLIETGARLGGATAPHIVERFCGISQTSLAATALINPMSLLSFNDSQVQCAGTLRCVELINHFHGPANTSAASKIEELPTAVFVASAAEPGSLLEPTTDLLSSPGYAYLAADERSEVVRDYDALRAWESEGLHTT
ncbi:ATP-grasp domain-containing protein [Streptomyces sp. NPDC096311]|uniref:ATP-grasp domain-containing protein n=1 Tax=Streptomyces sp. NPDC096311 TaxID=3366083 RepID=UPI0037FBC66F